MVTARKPKQGKGKPVKKVTQKTTKLGKLQIPPAEIESVTLQQARLLAKAAVAAPRGVAKPTVVAPASVGTLAAERKRLELQNKREVKQLVREYKATLLIMKRRGVTGLAPKSGKGVRKGKSVERLVKSFQPLQILAEGDSWFDYPAPFFGGGIIPRLEERLGVPILNLAKAGDEVRYMLGVEERIILADQLGNGCPAGGPWDVLLFSGGGNDIVDNPMALWIRDFDPTIPLANHIHRNRFAAVLELVRAGYEDLIAMRDVLSPQTHLVFHGYDFALPDGRGICHLGPWLKPTFDLRGFPTRDSGYEVIKTMLAEFAALLQSLESHPRVTFINAQGTLKPEPGSWHNELHPSKDGFNRFAAIFHDRIKTLFPGRVLR